LLSAAPASLQGLGELLAFVGSRRYPKATRQNAQGSPTAIERALAAVPRSKKPAQDPAEPNCPADIIQIEAGPHRALAKNRLHREMKTLNRPKLLIVDEVGYLQLDPTQASLLFQVISNRYENGSSIVLISNKALPTGLTSSPAIQSWPAPHSIDCCTAPTLINMRGDSYRLKERRKASASDQIQIQP
jgi:hypothetical protein